MKRHSPQKKLNRKRFFYWILLLILILVGFGFIWWQFWSTYSWNGHRRFNIVYSTNPIILVSFEKDEEEATLLIIPNDAYIEVVRGYGLYKASSIYNLGQLDKKVGGGRLLSETIMEVFGVPIDGFIKLGDQRGEFTTVEYHILKEKLFNLVNLINRSEINTNLNYGELIRFYWGINRLRTDQIKIIDLKYREILRGQKLPDGTTVGRIDADRLDKRLEDSFREKEILTENISIEIRNGTGKSGRGGIIARMIGNMGGKVVSVGNSDKIERDKCIISGNSKYIKSYTTNRLRRLFGCKIWETSEEGISDIVLVIGEGYLK